MGSDDLAAAGFHPWLEFNRRGEQMLLANTPSDPGVYVVRRTEPYQRRLGQSDITYIG